MFIAARNIITLRNQKPNAEVFAHCQHRSLGVLCPVVSLSTNFCLSSEIQPVLVSTRQKPEQEKAILQFLLGRDVFVALPTGYGIACLCYFVLPLVFDRVRDVSNRSI